MKPTDREGQTEHDRDGQIDGIGRKYTGAGAIVVIAAAFVVVVVFFLLLLLL